MISELSFTILALPNSPYEDVLHCITSCQEMGWTLKCNDVNINHTLMEFIILLDYVQLLNKTDVQLDGYTSCFIGYPPTMNHTLPQWPHPNYLCRNKK